MSDAELQALAALLAACEPILGYLDRLLADDVIGGPRKEEVAALREAVAAGKAAAALRAQQRPSKRARFILWWPELNRELDRRGQPGALFPDAQPLYEEGLEPRQAADRIVAKRRKSR